MVLGMSSEGATNLMPASRKKCPHGRRKYICKECKGSSLCVHGRQRHYCKECKGSQICMHGLHRPQCRRCNGNQICDHGRVRCRCVLCNPAGVYKATYVRHEIRLGGVLPPDFMSLELFCQLVKKTCIWCGRTPEQANGMGIDRKDNTKKHTVGNIEPCCWD